MKTLFIFLSCCVSLLYAQSSEQTTNDIREHYQWINAQKDFTVKELHNEDYLDQVPDQGAHLKGYFKNDTLYKIEEWFGLTRGNSLTEYYLWDGELIFVYQRESLYKQIMNNPDGFIGFDHDKPQVTFESRLHFKNGRLFNKNNRGKQVLIPVEEGDFHSDVQRFKAVLEL